jgi:hypothetical protein
MACPESDSNHQSPLEPQCQPEAEWAASYSCGTPSGLRTRLLPRIALEILAALEPGDLTAVCVSVPDDENLHVLVQGVLAHRG